MSIWFNCFLFSNKMHFNRHSYKNPYLAKTDCYMDLYFAAFAISIPNTNVHFCVEC